MPPEHGDDGHGVAKIVGNQRRPARPALRTVVARAATCRVRSFFQGRARKALGGKQVRHGSIWWGEPAIPLSRFLNEVSGEGACPVAGFQISAASAGSPLSGVLFDFPRAKPQHTLSTGLGKLHASRRWPRLWNRRQADKTEGSYGCENYGAPWPCNQLCAGARICSRFRAVA